MKRYCLHVLAALGAAFLLLHPAAAQPACAPRAQVLAWLGATYGEAPVAAGVTGGGELLEVLARADGTSWTILVTSPLGRTCVVAAGEGWRVLRRRVDEPKA
ncbi:MAG: hypothetical protein ACE5GS_06815 [Kiloniellaceae bacterium]